MPIFVGIDLPWTAHRSDVPYESGICVLDKGNGDAGIRCSRLEAVRMHINDIANWLEELANESGPVVVAIDAPLIVTPKRSAEKNLNKEFAKYSAGAFTTSMKWLNRYNMKAGPLIGEEIKRNFTLDPQSLLRGDPDEFVAIEVYPHSIHVRLFDLQKRILYKKGVKKKKRQGLLCYQEYLRQYLIQHAPSVMGHANIQHALAPETLPENLPGTSKKGPSLKHYEDMLDSLTCAIAAWRTWTDHSAWKMYGDAENGYIVAPSERPALP